MAIFRLEVKIFAREKRGRSIVAAAAYRSGKKLTDWRCGVVHDFSRRRETVARTAILAPDAAPAWVKDSQTLWDAVERSEARCDAQTGREFIIALPKELDTQQQWEAINEWARSELVSKGMAAEISLHRPQEGDNFHAHILCPLRRIEGDGFSAKKPREWNSTALLMAQRKAWERIANAALERAGRPERIDHRSLKNQGKTQTPEPKIGVAATAMKRKGVIADSQRHQLVRFVKSMNFTQPWVRGGEVHQQGMGKTWWERSLLFLARTQESLSGGIPDDWQAWLGVRRSEVPSAKRQRERSR